MAKLVYGLSQSLDGYVDHVNLGPPGPEMYRHFLEWTRSSAGLLYGTNMYTIMRYWEEDQSDWDINEHEFAAMWRSKPKWVVSRSLKSVGANATLIADDFAPAVDKLKQELSGEILSGGPNLAQSLTDAGLIDEYRLYIRPVVLGGSAPFFAGPRPPLRLTASDLMPEGIIRLTYVPA
ncbi:dihydrofolate reductase family protein [Granulicella paludicola]|uniref:dihydrofolate reductase family protein n=1 Tax=Granulicella paludicola TaxID=474951 RepID=UPI0021DF9E9B|nr:dihydrofolate reductase family protein [Granulicella paludicola]